MRLGLCARNLIILASLLAAAPSSAQQKRIVVNVDLVQVFATVTDGQGHYISGLSKEHFEIAEDKIKQSIETFSTEDVPISVGIVFDISGSMQGRDLGLGKDAVRRFLDMGNSEDDYFMAEFSNRPRVTVDFTNDVTELRQRLPTLRAKGPTAGNDALYLGLEKIRESTKSRKFLLMVTDGGDNHSRHSPRDIARLAMESNTQVYVVQIQPAEMYGRLPFADFGNETGGRTFLVHDFRELDDACDKIAREVRSQYVLSYRSTNQNRDGKYRSIRVRINPPPGFAYLHVRVRDGYFAPSR